MRYACATIVLLLVLAHAGAAAGETFKGKVIGVADGDTITVLRDKTPVKIRLQGVDTPEKAQPFGQKAKQFTSNLVFGKEVKVEVVTKDRYGRTVAKVSYLGKLHRNPLDRSKPHQVVTVYRSLQEALLQAGLAWWYRPYAPTDKKLGQLEEEARAAKRGLWATPTPNPNPDAPSGTGGGASALGRRRVSSRGPGHPEGEDRRRQSRAEYGAQPLVRPVFL